VEKRSSAYVIFAGLAKAWTKSDGTTGHVPGGNDWIDSFWGKKCVCYVHIISAVSPFDHVYTSHSKPPYFLLMKSPFLLLKSPFLLVKSPFLPHQSETRSEMWVCLKIGYIPNEIAI